LNPNPEARPASVAQSRSAAARAPFIAFARAAIAAIAVVASLGCSKPQPIEVTPRSAQVVSATPAGIRIALSLDVANPNDFDVSARSVKGTLEIGNGIPIGTGSSEPRTPIPARGSSHVPAELALGWTNLNALIPLALSGQPVPYQFRGTATVGGESLNMDVPFAIAGEITREQLLQIGLGGLLRPQ
jgi:LEA14-like dessication related protein